MGSTLVRRAVAVAAEFENLLPLWASHKTKPTRAGILSLVMVVAVAVCRSATAPAQTPPITELDFIGPSGINDNDQILGIPNPIAPYYSIYDLNSGTTTEIEITNLPPIAPDPVAINTSKIVGYFLKGTVSTVFLYDIAAKTYVEIPNPLGSFTTPTAINNLNQFVGTYSDPVNGNSFGFLWSNNVWSVLNPPPPFTSLRPTGINDAGQIVGTYGDGAGAFLFSNGTWSDLSAPPAIVSQGGGWIVTSINDAGAIIGSYTANGGPPNVFVYIDGRWLTFEIPGATVIDATGINNAGEIVGQYFTPTSHGGFVTAVASASLAAGKNLGAPPCACQAGNPINAATGNKFQAETDFTGAAVTGLAVTRYYNSLDTTSSAFGADWHSTWHRSLNPFLPSTVVVTRADGREDTFTLIAGAWQADPDVTSRLTAVSSGGKQTGWRLVTADDTTETYALAGQLTAVTTRAGVTTTLAYNSAGS